MSLSTTTLFLLIATVFCTSAAQVFQKRAAIGLAGESRNSNRMSLILNVDFLASVLLLGSALLLWLFVLARLEVSVAYPLLSINYVIVLLCAKWIFGEKISAHRWVGATTIVAGIFMLLSGTTV